MDGYTYNGAYGGSNIGQGNNNGDMAIMGQTMGNNGYGGQSLDEIVNQNAKAIRRQSMSQPYGDPSDHVNPEIRRMAGMDYEAASPLGPMGNFQYDPGNTMSRSDRYSGNATPVQSQQQQQHAHSRRQSHGDLALNTSLANSQGYNGMMQSSAYQSSAHPTSAFDTMPMNSPYMDPNMSVQMDFNLDQGFGQPHSDGVSQPNIYNQPQYQHPAMHPQMPRSDSQGTSYSSQALSQEPGDGGRMTAQYGHANSSANTLRYPSSSQSLNIAHASSPIHSGGVTPKSQAASRTSSIDHNSRGFHHQPQNPESGSRHDQVVGNPTTAYDGVHGPLPVNATQYNPNNQGFNWEAPEGGWPSTMSGRPHMQTTYKNAYSSTGFDMLGVLMRVATRKNPEITIGSVDLSCAFVVCDAEKDDSPIVYCSDNFERLTGYTKHMTLGRNCRFLQSPDGNVEPGVRRKYVDDDSVLYLKNMINLRREAQISLINYRRGGQPFMNLLTMIPISWDTDQVKFFVGFQVDLVEQPNALTNKNADGSYSINYQRGMTMPRYILNSPDATQKTDLGQTVPRDDVSAILTTFGNGESEYAKRVWDKVLLENTDDVVHVLSLKGLFQWVSPSAARVLEYEPSEIIGTALSSICHPSDIVPVTRELKDTSTGASVNIVFRIRRKNGGYMWFEGHGSLHTEQGKGRKSIILVGRERPVYTLNKKEIDAAGGIGENELWTKMSTSGMFLFISSNVRQLLDRQPDELVGVSIQSLMRADSKADFGRVLEHARTGKQASVKHEMINRRGQVLSAYTTLYPGDATEGLKPTFIVAQTRLIKFTRGPPMKRPSLYPKQERDSSESVVSATPSQTQQQLPQYQHQQQEMSEDTHSGDQTPTSVMSGNRYIATNGSAATYSGHEGLMIGHQDQSLASEDNLFDELKTTKSSSWQYEIRQLEKRNRMLAEEVQSLIAAKKKRKRRRGKDQQKDCANCHTRVTPEWRRGPSGQRDLCNSCGLRWAKLNGRVSPRTSSQQSVHSAGGSDKGSKTSSSPRRLSLTQLPATVKTESPSEAQPPLAAIAASATEPPRESPKAVKPPEGHGASMEGASGVPDKIDEGMEEPD